MILNNPIFQSTLPREERQLFVAVKVWYPIFQSTLPREERLCSRNNIDFNFISIHAPTRGATDKINIFDYYYLISIHAPTRGATIAVDGEPLQSTHFNPRSHERSDTNQTTGTKQIIYFNPRSHERSDNTGNCPSVPIVAFQSTLPREERHQRGCKKLY